MKRIPNQRRGGFTLLLERQSRERFRYNGKLVTSICVYGDGSVWLTTPTAEENHVFRASREGLPRHIKNELDKT